MVPTPTTQGIEADIILVEFEVFPSPGLAR